MLPCNYIEAFEICNNKCIVKEKNGWYCIDIEKRNQVSLDCLNVEKFNSSSNLLKMTYRNKHKVFSGTNRGGYNTYSNVHTDSIYLISMDGVKINIEFDTIGEFVNGKVKARKHGGYLGIIDEQGNTVIPFEYSEIGEFVDGKAKARKNNNYGVIDDQDNIIIPFEYSEIGELINGKIKAKRNRKWGYLDEKGNTVIPFEYSEIGDFIDGKAKAGKGDWGSKKYGYVDEQGNAVFEIIREIDNELLIGVEFEKWGIKDKQGHIILPFEYSEIGEFADGRVKAKKNGNWGCIDKEGNIVIPFEYSEIGEFIDGKAKVTKNCRYGYINEQGSELIDNVTELDNGLIKGKKFGKWGVQANNLVNVISFDYERIEIMRNYFIVIKSGNFELIKQNGLREQTIECTTNGLSDFGVFFEFSGIKGLLHINEINRAGKKLSDFSKGKIENLYIMSADINRQRISFSILHKEELTLKNKTIKEKPDIGSYVKNSIYIGTVTQIVQFGLFFKLEHRLDALLHISELRKHNRSIDDFNIGDYIKVKVLNIDKDKNRISLTLS